jgi:hypothetical protein
VDHFKSCFEVYGKATIVEVVKITSHFPSCVGDKDNAYLLVEVFKEELLSVLPRFQKDKSIG